MSVFERVTRSLVQEMDSGGDMIPVKSMVDAGAFKCGYLVRRQKRFWGSCYHKTDLTLEDILDKKQDKGLFAWLRNIGQYVSLMGRLHRGRNSDSKGFLEKRAFWRRDFQISINVIFILVFPGESAKFQVNNKNDSQLSAKLPEEVLGFHTLWSSTWGTTIIHRKISQQYLDSLVNKRLKQKLPSSFKTISSKENVYLVTETLETQQKETLETEVQYKLWSSLLKGISGESKSQNKITIPANIILAYRKKQLIFKDDTISIAFWTEEKRSFQGGMTVRRLQAIGSLQEQVQDTVRSLQELNEEERKNMLYSITSCATKERGLEDLEQRVYEVLISDATQAEGPAGPLIRSLHDKAGRLVKARAEVILELLDALIELPEQGKYVTEAIKNGTLSSLRDKVESILQKNWGEQISQAVSYDPEARIFCALYIASSLLLELIPSNKSTCVCS
ncbi:gasdermin-B [Cricetulus griseus]|uniref:Gasdermin-B n=1 Tax=Cricetulus griseus TaxID=10029 RepID=A0A9J7H563_CRIGR|nr:gasdermin-B [Cricetulus griseus]